MKFPKKFIGKTILYTALIAFIVLFSMWQLVSIKNSVNYLEQRDSSLITEIGQIKEAYLAFADDMNEVRRILLLPTKDYLGLEVEVPVTEEDSESKGDDLELAMFKYVDFLSESAQMKTLTADKMGLLTHLTTSPSFQEFLNMNDLKVGEVQENDTSATLEITNGEGTRVVFFFLSKTEGQLFLKTILSKDEIKQYDTEKFETFVTNFIGNNREKILEKAGELTTLTSALSETLASEEVKAVLDEKEIKILDSYEKDLFVYYPIYNRVDELIAEISLDLNKGEIHLIEKNGEVSDMIVTDVKSGIPPFLNKLNTGTAVEKKVAHARENLDAVIKDAGFQLLLSEKSLSISNTPEEDEDRFWYKIMDLEGNVMSAVVVEKATGVVNIVEPDGTNSENILFFDPEDKKKNLTLDLPDSIPDFGGELNADDGTYNILIAGKHGNLVDTMIVAHLDEKDRKVRMISIPRDLFYNGRKINSFSYFYGMPELKKVLSNMTGYYIDKYVLIDMYAFIDVIDLIGGVDVTLEKAVIDPTYRTVDNGVEGTLHYEPGDYHLGGKEALRLARSRHTSSDFARAERQQLILMALQDKARKFGFGDADTFYEIAKTVLNKTDTDVSLDEAISYYFRYQGFEIVSNNVMSSGNVLYVPPYITTENCQARIAAAQASGSAIPGCMNENHAYTLLPRDNNWNIIKWYFKKNFEGELETV